MKHMQGGELTGHSMAQPLLAKCKSYMLRVSAYSALRLHSYHSCTAQNHVNRTTGAMQLRPGGCSAHIQIQHCSMSSWQLQLCCMGMQKQFLKLNVSMRLPSDVANSCKCSGEAVLPSFDHGVGDPVPDNVQVIPQNKIVLVEGNYLLLGECTYLPAKGCPCFSALTVMYYHADVPPWDQLKSIFDDTWYIDCGIDAAMQRVLERQIGHGRSADIATWRVENNDRKNAVMIADTSSRAGLLVPSLPER